MTLQKFTDDEKKVIQECLRAAAEGPFFPEWEFHTLIGSNRMEVAAISRHLSEAAEVSSAIVNNVLLNLLFYPHAQEQTWSQFISVSENEVRRILDKLKSAS